MDTPQSFNKSSRILPWTPEFSHGPVDPAGPSTPTGGSGRTVLNKNNGRRVAGDVTVRLCLRAVLRELLSASYFLERRAGGASGTPVA